MFLQPCFSKLQPFPNTLEVEKSLGASSQVLLWQITATRGVAQANKQALPIQCRMSGGNSFMVPVSFPRYRGSFAPRTSIRSITGGLENSSGDASKTPKVVGSKR